jgi:bile acid:Na+ symporter, BASS family
VLHGLARQVRAFLANGPLVLTSGVVIGLAVPPLAEACRPLLSACVFIFVAGTFLRLDGRAVLAALRNPLYGIGLPVTAIVVVPLLVGGAASLAGWTTPLASALVLSLVAPPSSANAAIARMLRADDSIAFVVTTVATLALPVVAPLVLSVVGGGGSVLQPIDLALRLALLLGGAGALALVLRTASPGFVAARGAAIDGVVVGALFVFALATMSGVPKLIADDPRAVGLVIALAYGANVGLMILFTLLTPGSMAKRLGVGISMGNRNVGLIWAVLGTAIDPLVALYFAAAQFPIFTTPLLIRWVLSLLPERWRP